MGSHHTDLQMKHGIMIESLITKLGTICCLFLRSLTIIQHLCHFSFISTAILNIRPSVEIICAPTLKMKALWWCRCRGWGLTTGTHGMALDLIGHHQAMAKLVMRISLLITVMRTVRAVQTNAGGQLVKTRWARSLTC